MSYSNYPIKPQLSQLIFPTIIIELKGMADLKKRKDKKREKERKRTKFLMQKKRKTTESLFSN